MTSHADARSRASLPAAAGSPGAATTAAAHHSQSQFEPETTMSIEGTLTRLSWRNPHTLFLIQGKLVSGTERRTGMDGRRSEPGAAHESGWGSTVSKVGRQGDLQRPAAARREAGAAARSASRWLTARPSTSARTERDANHCSLPPHSSVCLPAGRGRADGLSLRVSRHVGEPRAQSRAVAARRAADRAAVGGPRQGDWRFHAAVGARASSRPSSGTSTTRARCASRPARSGRGTPAAAASASSRRARASSIRWAARSTSAACSASALDAPRSAHVAADVERRIAGPRRGHRHARSSRHRRLQRQVVAELRSLAAHRGAACHRALSPLRRRRLHAAARLRRRSARAEGAVHLHAVLPQVSRSRPRAARASATRTRPRTTSGPSAATSCSTSSTRGLPRSWKVRERTAASRHRRECGGRGRSGRADAAPPADATLRALAGVYEPVRAGSASLGGRKAAGGPADVALLPAAAQDGEGARSRVRSGEALHGRRAVPDDGA